MDAQAPTENAAPTRNKHTCTHYTLDITNLEWRPRPVTIKKQLPSPSLNPPASTWCARAGLSSAATPCDRLGATPTPSSSSWPPVSAKVNACTLACPHTTHPKPTGNTARFTTGFTTARGGEEALVSANTAPPGPPSHPPPAAKRTSRMTSTPAMASLTAYLRVRVVHVSASC